MFEDYLEDAYALLCQGKEQADDRTAKRYYRASGFYVMGAIEAFIAFIADMLTRSGKLLPYEQAFLQDRVFEPRQGGFVISPSKIYHRVEDKLRYLLCKIDGYDLGTSKYWTWFTVFKTFRDSITHPHDDKDPTAEEYVQVVGQGLTAVVTLIDDLCSGLLGHHLRKRLLDLRD